MTLAPVSSISHLVRIVGVLALLVALVPVGGCSDEYSQNTPDDVLVTARTMIKNGDARRLTNLIYADSKDMRKLLNQFGQTLDALQDLALSVQKAYPEEIAKLKAEAEAAAQNGQASSFISKLMSQSQIGQPRRRNRGQGQPPAQPPGDPDEMRAVFDNALKEVFADPYGWLAKSEGRLTTQSIADDRAAILWDGKPVFGVGLMMRLDQGKWYLELPTYAPGVSQIMPKSAEGWEILGGLLQVFDNTFTDLATDVKKGKCKRLDELAGKAGEKMFLPAAMVVFAYSQLVEADRKAAKEAAKAKVAETQPPAQPPGAPAATGK